MRLLTMVILVMFSSSLLALENPNTSTEPQPKEVSSGFLAYTVFGFVGLFAVPTVRIISRFFSRQPAADLSFPNRQQKNGRHARSAINFMPFNRQGGVLPVDASGATLLVRPNVDSIANTLQAKSELENVETQLKEAISLNDKKQVLNLAKRLTIKQIANLPPQVLEDFKSYLKDNQSKAGDKILANIEQ